MTWQIRRRGDDDIPPLVVELTEQQPLTNYPHRWPQEHPEHFIARTRELAAWVGEIDGQVKGHVALLRQDPPASGERDILQDAWTEATGVVPDQMGTIGALFVGLAARGTGLGRELFAVAVDEARARGLTPVLDVLLDHAPSRDLYLRYGWRDAAIVRPAWLREDANPVAAMWLPEGVPSRPWVA